MVRLLKLVSLKVLLNLSVSLFFKIFVHSFYTIVTFIHIFVYLVALGLDDADSSKSTLDVYKDHFERPFVEASEVYYKKESEKFVSENSVTDYMKKV